MGPIIEARELTKVFPKGVAAVDALDLRIRAGSVYGLIGPNGAGKTTLLRLLMGLLRPDRGTALVLQEDCGVRAVRFDREWRTSRKTSRCTVG
jgi:ABC-2 type transport system ATP-binding protein